MGLGVVRVIVVVIVVVVRVVLVVEIERKRFAQVVRGNFWHPNGAPRGGRRWHPLKRSVAVEDVSA